MEASGLQEEGRVLCNKKDGTVREMDAEGQDRSTRNALAAVANKGAVLGASEVRAGSDL